jgi:hypothetical protein
VAAYFAVADCWDRNGAVWLFQRKDIEIRMTMYGYVDVDSANNESLFAQSSPPQVLVVEGRTLSDRMIAQQGLFTVCRDDNCDHDAAVEATWEGESEENNPRGGRHCWEASRLDGCRTWMKLVIPRRLKKEFLWKLKGMNISADSLFPGIDGVGRSIAELVRMHVSIYDGIMTKSFSSMLSAFGTVQGTEGGQTEGP